MLNRDDFRFNAGVFLSALLSPSETQLLNGDGVVRSITTLSCRCFSSCVFFVYAFPFHSVQHFPTISTFERANHKFCCVQNISYRVRIRWPHLLEFPVEYRNFSSRSSIHIYENDMRWRKNRRIEKNRERKEVRISGKLSEWGLQFCAKFELERLNVDGATDKYAISHSSTGHLVCGEETTSEETIGLTKRSISKSWWRRQLVDQTILHGLMSIVHSPILQKLTEISWLIVIICKLLIRFLSPEGQF